MLPVHIYIRPSGRGYLSGRQQNNQTQRCSKRSVVDGHVENFHQFNHQTQAASSSCSLVHFVHHAYMFKPQSHKHYHHWNVYHFVGNTWNTSFHISQLLVLQGPEHYLCTFHVRPVENAQSKGKSEQANLAAFAALPAFE